jgi:hypothetical protein
MEDRVIWSFYESKIVQMMNDLDITVNEETIRNAKDYLADYLNQSMDNEIASYLDSIKGEIEGNQP